ncbi:uncharacterized protein LOC114165206 [Vigna unguiculata]|uniref:uncharacterized protein LOC114165206 n=1 Tax=Vigna unguiculata TaxID=3917 RepID=UPI0010163B5E|nr:uncharacterized protein LOC114165206 [Vigna unguiculata]
MPFRLLDNLDNLNQYNWSRSVHSFLVEGFNRAYHTLREDQNTSAITVAGSVAIFQLLVCRLLNVGSYEGDVTFPRILSWPSLVIRTHGIKSAFESNKVVLEWELSEDEKNIDVVREALNVAGHGIPKKGVDDMSFTKFKQWCKRKLKRNYRVVQQLKDQLSNMEKEYACGGQEADPSSFEEPEPSPFHKADHFDVEEPQCRSFDHPSSSHQPQPSSFEQGHAFDVEEPQSRDFEDPSSFHQAEPSCHDIGDGCDVEEAHAGHCNKHDQGSPEYNPHGMEIIPYVEPGKCSLDVDLSELYRILVSQDGRQTVVDINQQILTTVESCGFRPRGKLSNMAILFACNNFMYRQRKFNGVIKRVVFGTLYTTVVLEDSRKVKAKRREWVLGDYNNFLRRGLVSVHDIHQVSCFGHNPWVPPYLNITVCNIVKVFKNDISPPTDHEVEASMPVVRNYPGEYLDVDDILKKLVPPPKVVITGYHEDTFVAGSSSLPCSNAAISLGADSPHGNYDAHPDGSTTFDVECPDA